VLLDVPCTGSGVIKRNPDAKWKINKELLEQMVNLQSEILESYHIMTRPGGKLVYSTCSIFKKENREQVDRFLAKHPEYQLEKDYVFLPDETGYDGFYVAVLKRKV
jgi:16S rRNA (cytosine967-C5)-methyltransferase